MHRNSSITACWHPSQRRPRCPLKQPVQQHSLSHACNNWMNTPCQFQMEILHHVMKSFSRWLHFISCFFAYILYHISIEDLSDVSPKALDFDWFTADLISFVGRLFEAKQRQAKSNTVKGLWGGNCSYNNLQCSVHSMVWELSFAKESI